MTISLCLTVLETIAQTAPLTLWILKPNLKVDTVALIKNRIKKINVSVWDNYTDSIPAKYLYGSWAITSDTDKIKNCKWIWADSSQTPYWNFSIKFPYTKKGNKKIIQTTYKSKSDNVRLKMIHYINSADNVDKTIFYYLSRRYEDGYSLITRILYKYTDGLLTEADYYNDSMFVKKNICYLKFYFNYEY